MERFIVMDSAYPNKSSWKWQHPRRRVAVVERNGDMMPTQINPKHKAIKRIVKVWEGLYVGKTYKCQYQKALREAMSLAKSLNVNEKAPVIKKTKAVTVYKKVAISAECFRAPHGDVGYFSVYDGETKYEIGVEVHNTAKPGHNGGLYCYEELASANKAPFPENSVLKSYPKAILECKAWGRKMVYGDKLAFSHLLPVKVCYDFIS